jgi:competence protein ComEC
MQSALPCPLALAQRPLLAAAAAAFVGSGLGAGGLLTAEGARLLLLAVPVAWIAAVRLGVHGNRAGGAAVLALLAGACALRAAASRGELPRAGAEPVAGVWSSIAAAGDREIGRLSGGQETFAVPPGSLAEGEVALFLGREPPSPWAHGPVEGPALRSGRDHPSAEVDPDGLVRIKAAEESWLAPVSESLTGLRGELLARVSRLARPRTRGLVAGLLFGDLSQLPEGLPDLFVRTGTYHLLAISGLQVALVAVLLAGPLAGALALLSRRVSLGRLRPRAEAFRAILLLGFVPIAGAGAPVARSALAWALGSLAPLLRARVAFDATASTFMPRAPDSLSLWSLALLAECLLHPDAPLSLSVQLTYAATLGLILATHPLARILRELLPGRGRIGDLGRSGRARPVVARIAAQRALDAALYAVAASIAAVTATSPITWSRFGEWCPAGILATPLVALPIGWTLFFGWAWLLAPGLVPEAILDVPLDATVRLLELVDLLPGTPCSLPPRPFALLVAAAITAILVFRRAGARRHGGRLARATAAVWAVLVLPWTARPRALEIHALDVGHGTALVLFSPGGGVWIFDAGSRDRPGVDREALGPLLRRAEAREVGVVLSHADRDHDGALPWIVERFPPRLWAGALPAHLAARLPHTCASVDLSRGRTSLPDLDRGGSGLEIEISRGLDEPGNEGSCVLEVLWGEERLVLCGDAEEEGLAAWLRERPARAPARLLLLPHHGSDTVELGRILAAVRPREAWISASGSPVLGPELDRRGLAWKSTSIDGCLELVLP